jgi:hypothetical protein
MSRTSSLCREEQLLFEIPWLVTSLVAVNGNRETCWKGLVEAGGHVRAVLSQLRLLGGVRTRYRLGHET